jgi:hypothetical protein
MESEEPLLGEYSTMSPADLHCGLKLLSQSQQLQNLTIL